MNKQKIMKIVSLLMAICCLLCWIYLTSEDNKIKNECKALYEKEHLTAGDIKTESSFKSCVSVGDAKSGEIEVKYKKLYGIEHIGEFKLEKDDGIEVKFIEGNRLKILILDEVGNERFYREVSELYFEPGESGRYDVYVVGNEFTGKLVFKVY